jgi:hypothetical protein
MTRQNLIQKLSVAIARMEGFYKPGSIAQQNHNPGNLRSWGKNPINKGFAQFPSDKEGWDALKTQIEINVFGRGKKDIYPLRQMGLTFREFFAGQRDEKGQVAKGGYPGYAPDSDGNHSTRYAQFVCDAVRGGSIDELIQNLVTVQ